MNQITIKDKNNLDYVVEALEGSFEKNIGKGTRWSFEYSVKDSKGDKIGFGDFRVNCSAKHLHLEDREIFVILLKIGASKVKEDIDNNLSIESKCYNINTSSCRE